MEPIKGPFIDQKSELLLPYFYRVSLLVVFGLAAFFIGPDQGIKHLIFAPLYLLFAHAILKYRITGKDGRDYWGYKEITPLGTEENKELIVQGKIIESDLDEDHKEERFLRVADHSGRTIRTILFFLYSMSFVIGVYFTQQYFGNFVVAAHLIPFCLGALALLSTSQGQLLALPFGTLVIGFLFGDQKAAYLGEGNISLYVFFFLFMICLQSFQSLSNSPKEKDNNFKKAFDVKGAAILFCSLYLIIDLLLPKSFWNEKQPQKNTPREKAHQINKKLGKVIKKPSVQTVEQQKNLLKNLNSSGFKAKNFQGALKSLEKNMDHAEKLLKSDLLKNLPIPEMEKNVLLNSHRELAREQEQLLEQLQGKEDYTAEDIQALNQFLKKYKKFEKKMASYTKDMPPSNVTQEYNKGVKQCVQSLKNGLDQLPKGVEKGVLQKEIDELEKTLNINNTDKEQQTSVASLEEAPLAPQSPMKAAQNFNKVKEDIIKKVEKSQEPEPLIKPETLDKFLDFIKFIFIGFAVLVVLSIIQKLFSQDKIKPTSSREAKRLKKELLKAKRYANAQEEINDRYNIFMEGVRKLYFTEEEPPPPKILEAFLKGQAPLNKKALSYLTEVFSQSFYGEKSFPNDIIKKYRKAFRVLIKSL